MNINDQFPSKYLKSADLQGEAVKVRIREVLVEQIGDDRKMIIYFAGKTKGMVANKTNSHTIGDAYGDDTDDWTGKEIEIFAMKVDFQGRMVDGLRVRIPRQRPATATIAPNARDRASMTIYEPARAETSESPAPDFDPEEIPF